METENIEHLFFTCEFANNIWKNLEELIRSKTSLIFNFTIFDIIFGKLGNEYETLNLIITLTKYYIFTQSRKEKIPNFDYIKLYLKNYYLIEKNYIFLENHKNFKKRWSTLKKIFEF